ncbi:MAG TPA: GPW/gp25 family protein [Thermoanaerobaculia bacterium]|jgi:phage baseplate assembly protein W|nr:GPW/gp25 family protein [Thermoanaerobaculia bacterium]
MNIDFPFHISGDGRTAEADRDDHIRDMIEELLFTSRGERVNRPDFGSGLLQLVFGPNTPELAAALQFSLQADLQRWLGDLIELRSLEVTSVASSILITIQYAVRLTNEVQTAIFTVPA